MFRLLSIVCMSLCSCSVFVPCASSASGRIRAYGVPPSLLMMPMMAGMARHASRKKGVLVRARDEKTSCPFG